ncbi:MAG: PF20097 family protein [Pirellulaceae bacterium]
MKCPSCGAEMEPGYVNAPMAGIAWFTNPRTKFVFSKDAELLQKDWLGFFPFRVFKQSLRAARCLNCWLVVFWYGELPESSAPASNPPNK